MEAWQKTWREGFAPQLDMAQLSTLREALVNNDPRLIQGTTTSPPAMMCVQDWPTEAACALGLCAAKLFGGLGTAKIRDVEEQFALMCASADVRLNEAAACRYFLNFFDQTPRDRMRGLLLAEIDLELHRRHPAKRAA